MPDPTLDQRTPVLRLKFGAQDYENFNWWKLDDLVARAFTPDSPLQLPPFAPGSIPQTALAHGAAIARVAISTATTQIPIADTSTNLATINFAPFPPEDADRWELLLGQATIRFTAAATGLGNLGVLLSLRRGGSGGQDYQFRQLVHTQTAAAVGDIDEKAITLVRVIQPEPLLLPIWELNAIVQSPHDTQVTATSQFGQLNLIQFT